MKVLIDVPEIVYHMVMNTGTFGCYRFKTTKAIREGVAFSEDATNGDLIQAMFLAPVIDGEQDKFVEFNMCGETLVKSFPLEWWNAPYKESEEV